MENLHRRSSHNKSRKSPGSTYVLVQSPLNSWIKIFIVGYIPLIVVLWVNPYYCCGSIPIDSCFAAKSTVRCYSHPRILSTSIPWSQICGFILTKNHGFWVFNMRGGGLIRLIHGFKFFFCFNRTSTPSSSFMFLRWLIHKGFSISSPSSPCRPLPLIFHYKI